MEIELNMKRIAIIGAGVSGLTVANQLKHKYKVVVYEKESTPGGLIRCKRVDGNLYHLCGGHVFNSKRKDVLEWFWSKFEREEEFIKTDRNSVVFMEDDKHIPYPIENHVYLFDNETQEKFIDDLLNISSNNDSTPKNFEEFLKYQFGETLYNLYFKPYNEKVWRRNLKNVPLSWLEGKLPMPTVKEMIYNNINHVKEREFVHSTFWYEKNNGSQYIADKLAKDIEVRYNSEIEHVEHTTDGWHINGEQFDIIVFCGNIKQLPSMIKGVSLSQFATEIESLEYHGTTSVFCEIDPNPYSWIYLPDSSYDSHRIICTGNFSASNNVQGKMTATIEFTDEISLTEIHDQLKRIPMHPKYLDHFYNKYTYPIQDANTRKMIAEMKTVLKKENFYFTGRFADWEYYNMDIAMGAAIDLCKEL